MIQADGGTRTTSITGSFIAMVDALTKLKDNHNWNELPIIDWLAAISVGKVNGNLLLDLCYQEDSRAEVDMNVVMTGSGKFVEVQGTAESDPFTREEMAQMLKLAESGIGQLIQTQRKVLFSEFCR